MEITQKSKFKQFFCKHKNKDWYKEKEADPFSSLKGEKRHLVCKDCGKSLSSYTAEYEGMGFK